ncbi:MAG: anthranilate synthase component II [Ruminiclostridium sp.]
MYILIDNYDSFVYNLAAYMLELGRKVRVIRNDEISVQMLENLQANEKIMGIIISPGPKSPKESGISLEIITRLHDKIPILGVCLGHQIIAYQFGATVEKGDRPMHGKVSSIHHNNNGIFQKLPSPFNVTRYHSLVVKEENLPTCLQIDAKSEDGAIMAISHRKYPVFGVQFHPEAVLTEYGHVLLENYILFCERGV